MKLYRLSCLIREPEETDEGKYLAEVPALPGCRAWGDTAAEALENLQA
ncbi:MAG: type II toxin-antitoxin system HicB family antitoxin, partial [SAR202 cluster bacterium]|nr:type II toxin-antitoxin system HicB family antitoxin [SAR202 cluster bacterium]